MGPTVRARQSPNLCSFVPLSSDRWIQKLEVRKIVCRYAFAKTAPAHLDQNSNL
jgi:hypothetical protein